MSLETSTEAPEAWKTIRGAARQYRINIPRMKTILSSGATKLEEVVEVYERTANAKSQLDDLATTAGLDAYVQTILGREAFVATTRVAAVTAAMQAALNWMDTNASGLNLTGDTIANAIANRSVVTQRWNAAALSALRALLDDIETEIISS